MNIQWYPGHMTKAVRNMQEDIRIIDLIIEMVDARAPQATRNPDIDRLGKGKSRIIVMNKADLADEFSNREWAEYFKSKGMECIFMDARRRNDLKILTDAIERASKEKRERDAKKGIINRPVRAMVSGIPNVGKSTLINTLSGRNAAKTGNKPGVTKGNQWIRLNKNIELLDTPGILWPKFEDEHVGEMIAYIGSINDMIINMSELSYELGNWLINNKPEALKITYDFNGDDKYKLIEQIAVKRGCLGKGGELDLDKAELLLINDFRNGKLGRITLERP